MDSGFLSLASHEDSHVAREEQAASLRRFTGILRDKLRGCAGTHLSNKQFARDILSVLRYMLREESRTAIDPASTPEKSDVVSADSQALAVERMFTQLGGAVSFQGLFLRVYQVCADVLATGQTREVFDRAFILKDVEGLVRWYEQRRLSLLAMEKPLNGQESSIFALRHELRIHELYGTGIAVTASARLLGEIGDSFWGRLRLRRGGEFVRLRPGWETWSDTTDTFLRAVAVSESVQADPFCGLVPLVLQDNNRTFVDEVEFFVPFAALNISEESAKVELEVALLDRVGRLLSTAEGEIEVRSNDTQTAARLRESPQSYGLWPKNPVSRDSISGLKVFQQANLEGRDELSFECEVEAHSKLGRALRVEWRIIREDGEFVESDVPDVSSPDGTFCVVSEIVPQTSVALVDSLRVSVPTDVLMLPDGKHAVRVQAALFDSSGERLCGVLEPSEITAHFGQAPARRVKSAKSTPAEQDPYSGLVLELFGVDPDSSLARLPSVRMWLSLSQSIPAVRSFRIVMSVESDALAGSDTWKVRPIRHSFLWHAQKGMGRQVLITNIALEDLRAAALRSGEQVRYVARAQVYTLDDQLVFNRTRIFNIPRDVLNNLPALSSDQRALIQLLQQPRVESDANKLVTSDQARARADMRSYIADIRMRALPGEPRVRSLVTVALPAQLAKSSKFSIYHEIVDERGGAVGGALGGAENRPLQSNIIALPLADISDASFDMVGMLQVSVEVDDAVAARVDELSEGAYALKIMLFSEAGRLEHVLQQPLIVRRRHGAGADFPWLIDCDPHLSPERGTSTPPIFSKLAREATTWLRQRLWS